ncbi:MAG: 3-hydroxyacyl-CoA dehydrogenase NAD-binding domain-containing protein [Candidatus Polarisedimenticolia bacterium]
MIELTMGSGTAPEGIAEVRFDHPTDRVNLLSEASMQRLSEILDRLEQDARDGRVRGVAFTSGKPKTFLAGADVKAFVTVADAGDPVAAAAKAREGQRLFSRIAALPVPTVAAINGACLGGGLEMALACTSRLASDAPEVSIGLPEVRLGLVPGWGGTQRLPRLVGAGRALDLILTSRTLDGRRAMKLGVVDGVVPAEGIVRAGLEEAARLASGGRPRRAAWSLVDRLPPLRPLVYAMARRGVLKLTSGRYPAPLAAIEAVRFGLRNGIEEGLVHEAELCGRLLVGDISRNLVRIFLAMRAAAPGSDGKPAVRRVGVLGAGTMGGGIAAVAAMSGLPVRLRDVTAEALARGMGQVRSLASSASRKGRLSRYEAALREALVSPTTDMGGFGGCDLVVEAVVENLAVKRQVLADLEPRVSPSCIFATNTSSLSVGDIAAQASRPGRVVGLHFFNPVEKMPLVEVVRAPGTDPEVVEAATALAKRMGKTPVVVNDTPGFVVNRILMPYMAGAMELLAGGASVQRVDRALVDFGMPMGPFALLDRIGLDVAAHVAEVLGTAFPDRPRHPVSAKLPAAMAQAGLLGTKAGRGFYRYRSSRKGGAHGVPGRPSPEVTDLLRALGGSTGTGDGPTGSLQEHEIADRLVDAMVDEAARLLSDGGVDSPVTIDLAMVMGAGFPPFRGGLLRHADTVGREVIAARLSARGVQPAPLLLEKGRFHA